MKTLTLRLQKYLAERGVASRRGAVSLIVDGRVNVDGRIVTEPGFRIDPASAQVCVDGERLAQTTESPRAILLHKPRGCVCSRHGQGQPTIYDLIKGLPESLKPAGRLDADSEGLLVLANDGGWLQALTHPRYGAGKTYRIDIDGPVDSRALHRLRAPMMLDGYRIRSVTVRLISRSPGKTQLDFILHEGRNRQIRKMCAHVGLRVTRLVRIEQAGIRLGSLPSGQWRECNAQEHHAIRRLAEKTRSQPFVSRHDVTG